MITEALLVLLLYLILIFICWRFRYVITIMVSVEDVLNDGFFGDVVDTPKEGTDQHKKREELKGIIDKGQLGHTRQAMELLIKYMLNTGSVN